MTFQMGYLTSREVNIWQLRTTTNSQVEIARLLDVSRQAIHKALQNIDKKVEYALLEAAKINNLDVKKVDVVNGIMNAYSPAYRIPVVVSFSKINGLKVWYLYEGNCAECNRNRECTELLKLEAEERGFPLSNEEISPSKLAKKLFIDFYEGKS